MSAENTCWRQKVEMHVAPAGESGVPVAGNGKMLSTARGRPKSIEGGVGRSHILVHHRWWYIL